MGEIKTITFQFNISIFPSFRSHRLHYQVHIITKSLYPQGSQQGIMYGSSKIPKLRPILSALNTGAYKWEKFFVPLLRYLTSNEFTLKDSFKLLK